MKMAYNISSILSITIVLILFSCKKEYSCQGCEAGNKTPIAMAGPDQQIILPTDSVSLDGTASSDPEGRITSWFWRKISGPASFAILHSSNSVTKVENLEMGVYLFVLQVTDYEGLSAEDTVQVTVEDPVQSNLPPVANAGVDQTITLPTNTVNLDGGASSDPNNNITSYQWTKVAGPASFTIINSSSTQTAVTNLEQGVYEFELTITDAGTLSAKDTMQVIVNAPNANNWWLSVSIYPYDTLLNLSANSVNVTAHAFLNGQGTPPAPVLNSIAWRKFAGSGNYLIQTPNSLATTISNLTPGMYAFECKITDTAGRKDSTLTVISAPDPAIEQEVVIPNQPWLVDYGIPVYISINLNSYLPAGKAIKKVYIKQDCETVFTEVFHYRYAPANTFYTFSLGYGNNNFFLGIAHIDGSCFDPADTPDIKIVY